MKRLTALVSTALISIAGSVYVHASESGSFYVGADIGYGHFSRNTDGGSDAPGDGGAMAYGLRLGYNLSQRLALELAYTDNGDYKSGEGIACPGSCPPGFPAFSVVTTKVRSRGFNAVFNWPISERLRVNALAGYVQRKANMVGYEYSQNLNGALLGAGLSASLTRKLDVGIDWNIALLADEDLGTAWERHMEGSTSVASVGMRLRF